MHETVRELLHDQDTTILVHRLSRDESFRFRADNSELSRRSTRADAQLDAAGDEEKRAQALEKVRREAKANDDHIVESIRRWIRFAPGHVVPADFPHAGETVETGDQIIAAYVDHWPTMSHLFDEIAATNTLPASIKNGFRRRHAFAGGTAAASPGPSGPRPASAAPPASTEASKSSADA